ncbi:HAD family hydrolase [Microterricola viridarii]|uniref:Hydrolase n=1 Tax=Microterricola viridarii TaxID=412690 RepID=A0A0X8E1A5_9MICO|nr:HAD family phosphatase [Microterricola viridarii]AMB58501.1 hydrolase [Microterricola viridarii]
MTTDTPAAVLWDMDGTIVDTEPYWMQAESELVGSFGGVWTHEDGLKMVGNGLSVSAGILQGAGVRLDADEIIQRLTGRVQELLKSEGVPWRPGARELLAELSMQGIPCALVTMSMSPMAEQIVDLIGFPAFRLIVAGDHVAKPKPDPEAYLLAATQLGVPIERCVAFEDSVPGVAAAAASGAVTIGVPHIIELPAHSSYTLWPSLAGRTLSDIATVFVEASRNQEVVTP